MAAVVFSIEGRGLKLDAASDVQPFVEELEKLENVTDIRLSGNTFNVEAATALAAAIAKHRTIQVRRRSAALRPPPWAIRRPCG